MKPNIWWKVEFFHADLKDDVFFEAKSFSDCAVFVASALKFYPDGDYKFVPFIKEEKE